MTAATPGTAVTSLNPNNQTNTSLTVTLASTTVGTLNIIEITGDATGTGVVASMNTPTGWTLLDQHDDTNAGTGSSSSHIGIYWRVYQSGDPSTVAITWTNAGQMVAVCTPFTGQDGATPLPYSVTAEKATSDVNYTIGGTTGTDPGLLCYGFANRSITAWSSLSDNARATATSGVTMVSRITSAEVAGGTVFTKTATGTSTSIGVSWAYVVKGAVSGSTYAGAAVMTSASSLAGTVTPPGANAAMTSASALTGTTTGTLTAAGGITSASSLSGASQTPIVRAVTNGAATWVAHRGGYAPTLGEETLEAYTASASQYSGALLEISVYACSTGEYVCSHDSTTGRVFGTNYTISSTSWTTLSSLRSTVGGNSIRRLTDVLDAPTLAGRLFLIDNKSDTNAPTLTALLNSHVPGRWAGKQYYTASATWLAACQNAGAPVWAYFYPADLGNMATCFANLSASKSPIVFGLGDYSAAPVPVQSDASTFFSFVASNGLLAWAHILSTTAQKSNADSEATTAGHPFDGYMTQGFAALAPTDGASAALVSGSSLGGTAGASYVAGAGMTSGSNLTGAAARGQAATASMSSASTLTGTATAVAQAAIAMTSGTALTGPASLTAASSAGMASGSSMTAAATVTEQATAAMTSGSTLTGVGTATRPVSAGTVSGSVLTGTVVATDNATAPMTSGSNLAGAAALQAATTAVMQSASALTGNAALPGTNAAMTSASALSGAATGTEQAAVGMASNSTLTGDGTAIRSGTAAMASGSNLAGATTVTAAALSAMASVSSLASIAALARPAAASMTSGSTLSGAGTLGLAAGMTSSSSLSTAASLVLVASAGMTSGSALAGAGTIAPSPTGERDIIFTAVLAAQQRRFTADLSAQQRRFTADLGAMP